MQLWPFGLLLFSWEVIWHNFTPVYNVRWFVYIDFHCVCNTQTGVKQSLWITSKNPQSMLVWLLTHALIDSWNQPVLYAMTVKGLAQWNNGPLKVLAIYYRVNCLKYWYLLFVILPQLLSHTSKAPIRFCYSAIGIYRQVKVFNDNKENNNHKTRINEAVVYSSKSLIQ